MYTAFFYFYFVNEHFLRFLGKRYPDDYNKLPSVLYWTLHLVWLFPWSLYLPIVIRRIWVTRARWWNDLRIAGHERRGPQLAVSARQDKRRFSTLAQAESFRKKTIWLLSLYAGFILIFFSISTNQEYYTYPAYFPLLLLTAGALARAEGETGAVSKWLNGVQAAFAIVGLAAAGALSYGLWASRKLPYVPDIGTVLAHRNVAGYTLSMSHFFDLSGPSFAALRLPASIAAAALLLGPAVAWTLRRRKHHFEATVSVAFTAAIFLIAAHIALVRFQAVLSSRAMADTINRITGSPHGNSTPASKATLILYGDSSEGSSIIFYTRRQALLVNGRISSMIWGSEYPDIPHIFLSDSDLLAMWGKGPRKFLFVPEDSHEHVSSLLGSRGYVLQERSDKTLYTDRPLDAPLR